jgi:hypothetical protein
MKDVYWCPVLRNNSTAQSWKNVAYFEPEPVVRDLVKSRNKDVKYFQCPAFLDYFKNTFVIRAPVDITINVVIDNEGKPSLRTFEYDQEFFNDMLFARFHQNEKFPMLSFNMIYLFFSKETQILESLPAFLHNTELIKNSNLIPGTFDISKWIRPIDFTIEVLDETKPIKIKRGDPLLYIRFVSDEKINLVRTECTDDLRAIMDSCTTLKKYVYNSTLLQNYEAGKSYVNYFKEKFFSKKSKCPFHFWKK